jgi:hypothetical protein
MKFDSCFIWFIFVLLSSLKASMCIILTGVADELIMSKTFISPNKYDIMLTDIKKEDLRDYSRQFGFEYNAVSKEKYVAFPVQGIIAEGTHSRLLIPLTVHYKKVYVKTLFLVDTGSPYVFLSQDTFNVLGISDTITVGINLLIEGKPVVAHLSTNHFSDINVIGAKYLSKHSLHLSVRYDINKVLLNTTSALTPDVWEEL